MKPKNIKIFKKIKKILSKDKRCVLATVVSVTGSAPGKSGFKLLIEENGKSFGTVGGGCVEEGCRAISGKVLEDGKSRTLELNLDSGRSKCGGRIKVFIERID
ncbi:MAG: XdhC family protein [Elusimicrobiota bacterium]